MIYTNIEHFKLKQKNYFFTMSLLPNIMVLEQAKTWALDELVDEYVVSILLVGSWARGEGSDVGDIDIIVIKEAQLVEMFHQEHDLDNFTLDVWVHDKESMENELFTEAENLTQIINASLTLSFIPNAKIWYDKESYFEELRNRVSDWSWKPEYKEYLEFDTVEPSREWAKIAYKENNNLLEAAKKRISSGKPITHRRKDYPELISEESESKAKELTTLTETAYQSLGIQTNWPEFQDARKAMNTSRWGTAVAMLKDVLRYMIRYELPSVPEELLDPSLWKTAEEMSLSEETLKALEKAYL